MEHLTLQNSWRPAFAFAFILFFSLLGLVIMYLLVSGRATIAEASGVIITMIAAGGGVTGAYTVGRTQEKKNNAG